MKVRNNRSRFFNYAAVALILLFAGLFSCKKSGTDCLTNAGPITREVRNVPEFDSIDMEDYVNLFLSQDSVIKVEVEAGQNILDGIETKVVDRQLVIKNNIICNWVRSYSKPINVYVSVKNLSKIFYNSSGNIHTLNPIRSTNLKVIAWGGAGSIDMELAINGSGYFYLQSGTVDFNLHGTCSICSIYAGDFGLIQAKDLQTGYAFVTNHGSNDVYVRAHQFLSADIESIGNIYYTGNPDSLEIIIHGPGEVIAF
jgi:hypothetical protein